MRQKLGPMVRDCKFQGYDEMFVRLIVIFEGGEYILQSLQLGPLGKKVAELEFIGVRLYHKVIFVLYRVSKDVIFFKTGF